MLQAERSKFYNRQATVFKINVFVCIWLYCPCQDTKAYLSVSVSDSHVCLSACLCFCQSYASMSIYMFIYLSVYLYVCMSVRLSIYFSECTSNCLSIYVSDFLSVLLSACRLWVSIVPNGWPRLTQNSISEITFFSRPRQASSSSSSSSSSSVGCE